jgi:serine protease Do
MRGRGPQKLWTLWAVAGALAWSLLGPVDSGAAQPPGSATDTADPASPAGQAAIVHAKALSRAFRQASERVRPGVVTVLVQTKPRPVPPALRELLEDPRLRELFPDGFDAPGEQSEQNPSPLSGLLPPDFHVGSGLVVDASGVILTNHHVVELADQVIVRLSDGQELKGQQILSDPMSDVAIIRVSPTRPLDVVPFGDSEDVAIGDWVIAIGSPFELEATVSAGIISAKGRGIEKIKRGRLLQTDAAINPGNSGGPLVNLDGEVIGISTAIATSNGGYQGVGFAIPANRAQWIWKELSAHGKVRRAYLGIGMDELTFADSQRMRIPARAGVWVRRVLPESAAADAGVQENDVVIAFADTPVRMPRDLQDVVEQSPVGEKLPLQVLRDGKPLTLEVELRPFEE